MQQKLTEWTCDECGECVTEDDKPRCGGSERVGWLHITSIRNEQNRERHFDLCSIDCLRKWIEIEAKP